MAATGLEEIEKVETRCIGPNLGQDGQSHIAESPVGNKSTAMVDVSRARSVVGGLENVGEIGYFSSSGS